MGNVRVPCTVCHGPSVAPSIKAALELLHGLSCVCRCCMLCTTLPPCQTSPTFITKALDLSPANDGVGGAHRSLSVIRRIIRNMIGNYVPRPALTLIVGVASSDPMTPATGTSTDCTFKIILHFLQQLTFLSCSCRKDRSWMCDGKCCRAGKQRGEFCWSLVLIRQG